MKDGINKAIEILDAIQARYLPRLNEAQEREDEKETAYWEGFLSALTAAVIEMKSEKGAI